jgi:hypothetical protein
MRSVTRTAALANFASVEEFPLPPLSLPQKPSDLELNLLALARSQPHTLLAIFASVEDPASISHPSLTDWHISPVLLQLPPFPHP